MVQGPSPDFLATLCQPCDRERQLDHLRSIKTFLIGHDQRKEVAVKNGLLRLLVHILTHDSYVQDHDAATPQSRVGAALSQTRIQAVQLLAIVAAGGAQFVAPLLAASVDAILISCLKAHENDASSHHILKALRNLLKANAHARASDHSIYTFSSSIRDSDYIRILQSILQQSAQKSRSLVDTVLVCDIIIAACQDEQAKHALLESGLPEDLASLLLAQLSSAEQETTHETNRSQDVLVERLFTAICTLVAESNYRIHQFMHYHAVRDYALNLSRQADMSQNGTLHRQVHGQQSALPSFQLPPQKNVSFTSEIGAHTTPKYSNTRRKSAGALSAESDRKLGSAVLHWLILLVRESRGGVRLAALWLLALIEVALLDLDSFVVRPMRLYNSRERERQLALLIVPMAVRLLQDSADSAGDPKDTRDLRVYEQRKTTKERCGDILAKLIQNSKELQCAAADAGAIKHAACPVLRKSFENVALSKPMWMPRSSSQHESIDAITKLGRKGLPDEVLHVMKCRLGALEALTALAEKEDYHRKTIIDSGVVTNIIASLKPFPIHEGLDRPYGKNVAEVDGNTHAVILAACHAAQKLSRSVSLLRTSLIDAGIAKPILDLLQHPNVDIQVAATDVCANLVLEFSPMREDCLAQGVVATLCGHAKTGTPALKISSMWALKHLVLNANIELKISMLRELELPWLLEAIDGDTITSHHNNGGVALNLVNAAGDRVELLNPSSMDIDGPITNRDDEDEDDGEMMYDEASRTHYHSSSLRSTLQTTHEPTTSLYLAATKESEQDIAAQSQRHDLEMQEQALDFLRNVFSNEQHCADMVEHVFQQVGQQKLLDLLTMKLSPISASQHRHHLRSSTAKASTRPLYGPSEVISSTVHVLVHIANGSATHKAALVAQRAMLQAIHPHFSHENARIRAICVWFIIALTWTESGQDKSQARHRARELRNHGLEAATRALVNDPDLDVRERVKTASSQMDNL